MTAELFPSVLDHFFKHMGTSKEQPHMLIFDNHASHMTLDVVIKARERGVVIVTLPAHCSHRLQPMDISVLGPWKTYFADAVRRWHLEHPATPLTIHDLSPLVNDTFGNVFTIPSIANGFRKSGIWPLNRDVFTEADFLGARLTESADPTADDVPATPAAATPGPSHLVSPEEVRPLPHAVRRVVGQRGRTKRLPIVLTSTPEKKKLEEQVRGSAKRLAN